MEPTIRTVAVVGSGVIGRSWARVFIRAGCQVRLWDGLPGQTKQALAWLTETLAAERALGFIGDAEVQAQRALLSAHDTLTEALVGVGYVQESTTERLPIKQALFVELDRLASPDIILASSTSALDMTQIAAGLPGAHRCVVAHPVNPPHVIPAVRDRPRCRDLRRDGRACRRLPGERRADAGGDEFLPRWLPAEPDADGALP